MKGFKNDLRDTMADWIENKGPWDMWFTGTFKPEFSYKDPIKTKAAFGRFVNDLGKKNGCRRVGYFMAVERFKHGFETHVHAVMNGVQGLTYREIGETWRDRFGREKVEKYEPGLGADHYLTKYVTKDLCDWDFHFRPEEKNLNLFEKKS